MTLILARASAEFILQVTDRLVTNKQTKQPFDKVANKNILYFASNAVVAIAYTGDAYLADVPTDHWIAEKLAGMEIDPENPPANLFGQIKPRRDVGQAFRFLRDELARQNQRKQLDLLISVQGWQWNSKGRLRPLVSYITKAPPQNTFFIHYEPRDWYLKGTQTISAPKANMSDKELTDLSNHLRYKSATEAEVLLVDKIREISQCNDWVGPHCMSILLPPPSNPNISVHYYPGNPFTLSEKQKLADEQHIWAYSPWIVSPSLCRPPSQITGGGFTARTGPFSIQFASHTPQHPEWLLADFGQKRRKRP